MVSATSSSHPLRNATFPTDGDDTNLRRSPSFETSSIVSGSVAGGPKKRTRGKGKGKAAAVEDEDDGKTGGAKYRKATVEDGDEEDEEDDDLEDMDEYDMLMMENRTDEQKAKDAEQRAMLIGQFDPDQFDRHSASRMVRFGDAPVRRVSHTALGSPYTITNTLQLINQTVSQSVPGSVVFAIKSVAKVFTGDLIEEARRVQAQWNAMDDDLKLAMKNEMMKNPNLYDSLSEEVKHEQMRLPVGPLEPDHLREAIRRMKNRQHEGGVGMQGLPDIQHHSGVERFATKKGIRGKRLFK
jgi:transcription initiation factor TFIID subunit 11